jgi:hypothetical protein
MRCEGDLLHLPGKGCQNFAGNELLPLVCKWTYAQHSKAYLGKLHICLDGWMAPQVIAFIGVTMHWIVEGQMKSLILDFIKYVALSSPCKGTSVRFLTSPILSHSPPVHMYSPSSPLYYSQGL